jgi:hypothetical protein
MGALNEVPQVEVLPPVSDFDMWACSLLAGANYPEEHQNFSPELHQYIQHLPVGILT